MTVEVSAENVVEVQSVMRRKRTAVGTPACPGGPSKMSAPWSPCLGWAPDASQVGAVTEVTLRSAYVG